MNPILKLALSAALKYLESHPEQIEKLVAQLIEHLLTQVNQQ
jgi:hypothetical protein